MKIFVTGSTGFIGSHFLNTALSLRIRHSPSISAFSFQVSGFLVRISHLTSYSEENAIGPLQRDEAVALFGIVRAIRPKTVVEFGFLHGHSAFNFLMALDADAKLVSYDISDVAVRRAREEFAFDPRFTFFHKSQTAFDWNDVDNRPIDFVFFDAAQKGCCLRV